MQLQSLDLSSATVTFLCNAGCGVCAGLQEDVSLLLTCLVRLPTTCAVHILMTAASMHLVHIMEARLFRVLLHAGLKCCMKSSNIRPNGEGWWQASLTVLYKWMVQNIQCRKCKARHPSAVHMQQVA